MNIDRLLQVVLGLVVGVVLVGLAMLRFPVAPGEVPEVESISSVDSIHSTDQTTVVSGTFSGLVDLNWVLTGEYSSTLATPTPEPGGRTASGFLENLDLALRLEQMGNRVSGHVVLDKSLAFPQLHTETIDGEERAIGPRVTGTYDGETLRLESERFEVELSPDQSLSDGTLLIPRRTVTRQFSLTSSSFAEGNTLLAGEYRETLWGFDIRPSTVIGELQLNLPNVRVGVPTLEPTVTPGGPTATRVRPTATPVRPTATPVGPTVTPGGPTATPVEATETPSSGETGPIYLPILQPEPVSNTP